MDRQITLPFEILVRIFSFLTPNELCSVAQVCKMFNKASNDVKLWKSNFVKKFGIAIENVPLTLADAASFKAEPEGTAIKQLYRLHCEISRRWRDPSSSSPRGKAGQLLKSNHYSQLFSSSDFIAELDVDESWRNIVAVAAFQPSQFSFKVTLWEPLGDGNLSLVWDTRWSEFRENTPSLVKKGLCLGSLSSNKVLLLGPSDQNHFLLFNVDTDSRADDAPPKTVVAPDSVKPVGVVRSPFDSQRYSPMHEINSRISARTGLSNAPAPAVFGSSPTASASSVSTTSSSSMSARFVNAPHSRKSSESSVNSQTSSVSAFGWPEPHRIDLPLPNSHLTCVALNQARSCVAAGTREKIVHLFDFGDNCSRAAGELNTIEYCTQTSLHGNLAYVGTRRGVEIFDLHSSAPGKRVSMLRHRDSVLSVQPVPWCHLVVTSSYDRVIKIWDDRTLKTLHSIPLQDVGGLASEGFPSVGTMPPPSNVHYGIHRLLVQCPGSNLFIFDRYTFQLLGTHSSNQFNGQIMACDETLQRAYGSAGFSNILDTLKAR